MLTQQSGDLVADTDSGVKRSKPLRNSKGYYYEEFYLMECFRGMSPALPRLKNKPNKKIA
jgi:hypothetical protein